ncbi:hypothetical protein J6590_061406 [Homalodisca vitripennis]|nr:hypothetical protein J6590_061406 [Homalodisca vitripennis]
MSRVGDMAGGAGDMRGGGMSLWCLPARSRAPLCLPAGATIPLGPSEVFPDMHRRPLTRHVSYPTWPQLNTAYVVPCVCAYVRTLYMA